MFSSRAELQSPVAIKIKILDSFALKGATIQGIEDNFAKTIETGFLAADTGVKHPLFCFIKMAIADMEHHELMDKFSDRSFEFWPQSEVLTNKLSEEMCKHPSLAKRVLEITSPNYLNGTLVQNKSTVKSKEPVELSSMASEDDFTMKHKRIRHKLGKHQVTRAHQRMMQKVVKHNPSTSSTQSEAEKEYKPSQSAPPSQTYWKSETDFARNAARQDL